ncbi:MAG: pyridoxine 5'-phosphate synthase [Verrucomicrobiota bacterium]
MLKLGVNIDHVATVRQARYKDGNHKGLVPEPSPVEAAKLSLEAGAHSITAHLREDRRHIQDADVWALRREVSGILNLEMAVTNEMVDIALQIRPHEICLVPENRKEVTTEGGLDVLGQFNRVANAVKKLQEQDMLVSLFIDPDQAQIEASAKTTAKCIELHTGAYANALGADERESQLYLLKEATVQAKALGLQVNAGHGLNYQNIAPIVAMHDLDTLNIGHSIVSRALSVGFKTAVSDMLDLLI